MRDLAADFAGTRAIGARGAGFRSITPVTGGSFEGERPSTIARFECGH